MHDLDLRRTRSQNSLRDLDLRQTRSQLSFGRPGNISSDLYASSREAGKLLPLVTRPLSLWERRDERRTGAAGKFCDVCRKLNIEKWIGLPIRRQKTIGRWDEICSECPFCRLVIDCVLQSGREVEGHKFILLDNELSWKLCTVYALYDGGRVEGYSNARDLRATAKQSSGRNAYRFIIYLGASQPLGQIQYIADADPTQDRAFFGRKVDQQYANLGLIKAWLPRCRRIHGRSCEESGDAARRLPVIRVVDVYNRLVITAPIECRYVTLSYVWGHCQHWKTIEDDVRRDRQGNEYIELPDRLPQTLEDAIYVTRVLGERYLWIDALCIIQNRKSEKHAQILRMDAIYSSAVLTIAAASGSDANAGLAGISRPRRVPQRTEVVDGLRFALPLPDYMSLESDRSLIWNSRGWTFQEKILSKRLLLFTDYQVYFQCSNMVWCEDTALETERCSASTKKKWRPLRWAGDRLMGETTKEAGVSLGNYMSVIKEFTRRIVTDPEDRVDAIQGVLGTLEPAMGTFHLGMPEDYFGPALLWQPPIGSVARMLDSVEAPFPSWCWARWEFPKGCAWQKTQLTNTYLTHVTFILDSKTLTIVPLGAPASSPRPKFWLSNPRYVTSLPKGSSPPPVSMTREGSTLLNRIGCMLYLKSELATVHIGDLVQDAKTIVILRNQDLYMQYKLVDECGFCLGDIRMSAGTRGYCGNKSQEFMTLCWSTGYVGPPVAPRYVPTKTVSDGESTSTVDMAPYEYSVANVILVNWVGNVAQRVALGNIVSTAWTKYTKKTKWILVG